MSDAPVHVLHVEDNPGDAKLILLGLREAGLDAQIVRVETEPEYLAALEAGPDIVLCDFHLPRFDARRALDLLRQRRPEIPLVVISGTMGEETAAEMMRLGAADYLLKDRLGRLGPAVRHALEERKLRAAERRAQEAVRAAEAFNRAVLDSVDAHIAVLDRQGRIVAVNEAWRAFARENAAAAPAPSPDCGVGRDYLQVCRNSEAGGCAEAGAAARGIGSVLAGGEACFRMEYSCPAPDRERWFLMSVTPLRSGEGGAVASHVDITDRKLAESERQRAADLLRAVAEQTPDAMFVKDREGRYLLFNPAASRFVGKPIEAVLGRTDAELFDPAGAALLAERDRRVMETGRAETQEEQLTAAGVTRTYLATKAPYRDAEGRVVGTIGISRDISDRKQAQESLQESQERLQMALDAGGLGTFDFNPVTGVLLWDARTKAVFGIGADEPTSAELFYRSLHPDDRPLIEAGVRAALDPAAPEAYGCEYRVALPGGDIRWVAAAGRVTFEGVGAARRAVRFIGTVLDVTDRKRAEAALARDALLLANVRDAVVVTDLDGIVTYWNEGAAALFGWTAVEMLGRPMPERVPEEGRAAMAEAVRSIRAGREFSGEWLDYRRDGSRVWIDARVRHVADARGVPVGLMGISHDITARKRAEESAHRQLARLDALRTVDQAISGSLDLRVILHVVLDQVLAQLGVDAAEVLLSDPHTRDLAPAADRGFRGTAMRRHRLRPGEGVAGRAWLEQRVVQIPDLRGEADFTRIKQVEGEGFVAYAAAPMVVKGKSIGVLEVFRRSAHQPDDEWLDFLKALAGQAAIAVDNAGLFRDLERSHNELVSAYDSTLEGWVRFLDLRDKETEGHTQRVTDMTVRLARAMGVGEAEIVHVRRGALLHDIGKMGIPDSILLKPGPLTEEEWVVMRRHPQYAYDMLAPIRYLRPALDIPYCHHEKWDGTGYPRGLKGEQIPFAARLFAAADIWDALSSDRPYRKGWPREKVAAHIRSLSGAHLDPAVVTAFLRTDPAGTANGNES